MGMSTYRERRERRAERLREWADKRDDKADAEYANAARKADAIPFGQPILTGHYSARRDRNYRDGIARGFERSFEHSRKADDMRQRAANIEAAAANAIYSDDLDACERLREKIERLEAERDRWKRYNASCRKGAPDPSILDEQQRAELVSLARVAAWQIRANGSAPAYVTSNLSGNIARLRKRLASLGGAA